MRGLFIFLVVAFASSGGALALDLPECVYDAFPELNQTVYDSYYGSAKPKGLVCDLCVTLLTDIEEILLDQDIEDAIAHAVENLCLPIIWAFEPCYKLMEACLPDLIQSFVESLVSPREFCELLFICPEIDDPSFALK